MITNIKINYTGTCFELSNNIFIDKCDIVTYEINLMIKNNFIFDDILELSFRAGDCPFDDNDTLIIFKTDDDDDIFSFVFDYNNVHQEYFITFDNLKEIILYINERI